MATATIVITYTPSSASISEAVVTSATVGGTAYVSLSATELRQAFYLSRGLANLLVADGKFAAGVNGQISS